jgi:MYXO-CTERM domain-containing protein
MSASIVVCIVWFLAVALVCVLATIALPRVADTAGWVSLRRRLSAVTDTGSAQFSRPVFAGLALVAGWGITLAIGWGLGRIAHALQGSVDWPVFNWFNDNQVGGVWVAHGVGTGSWNTAWWKITKMGGAPQTQVIALVGAGVLGLAWAIRRRRWWVPILAILVGYCTEKYGQIILQDVVHRGHPPTTLGTFPSGGCARIIVIYGLIILLTLRLFNAKSRRLWVGGCALTGFFVSIEVFSRTYNLEHWITDVAGGLAFGSLLLASMCGAVAILDRDIKTVVAVQESGPVAVAPEPVSLPR